MTGKFVCRRCGICCIDLLIMDNGVQRGLILFPDETNLFPQELIKPYIGIGKRPYESGFKIIAYQLTENTCPNLKENQCTVYDNRPVTCRQFPFSLDLDKENEPILGVDLNCPAAVELVERSGGVFEFGDRMEAEKLVDLKRVMLQNPRRVWFFDLSTLKWVRYDKIMS